MDYFVYILQSAKDGSFYIGYSENPSSRLEKHNRPHSGYTGRKQPWKIVYTEQFDSKAEAQKREQYIKKMKSKDFILKLINGSSAG
ncbi:GIY-YIG nuclease family protein [Anditalea andensis]|uniref:Excinuclease ABC subunit C n=1 Tax=Anditalea andensis TaxID=1048983 RepID=A0A074KVD3_9BACT|nr:GIY-YIG nuclease family protein [Anditalea andensis]KEO73941.1 excinuclease ABC subunit C [Anditalea andensis]